MFCLEITGSLQSSRRRAAELGAFHSPPAVAGTGKRKGLKRSLRFLAALMARPSLRPAKHRDVA